MQNVTVFLTTFVLLPPAVLQVFGSQHRHRFWRFVINIVHYKRKRLLRTYMEEHLCLWTTAGVYEQEERTLLNISSSVGSLGKERLYFRSVPPRSRWILKCAPRPLLRQLSCPAAILGTGIPGRRGEGGLWRHGRSTNRWRWSRHDDKEINRPKKPPVRSASSSGDGQTIGAGAQVEVNALFVVSMRLQLSPPFRWQFAESSRTGGWLGRLYGCFRKHTGVPQMHLRVYSSKSIKWFDYKGTGAHTFPITSNPPPKKKMFELLKCGLTASFMKKSQFSHLGVLWWLLWSNTDLYRPLARDNRILPVLSLVDRLRNKNRYTVIQMFFNKCN